MYYLYKIDGKLENQSQIGIYKNTLRCDVTGRELAPIGKFSDLAQAHRNVCKRGYTTYIGYGQHTFGDQYLLETWITNRK